MEQTEHYNGQRYILQLDSLDLQALSVAVSPSLGKQQVMNTHILRETADLLGNSSESQQ